MASVVSQLIEEVTAHTQRDILKDAREICADGTYFSNNLRISLAHISLMELLVVLHVLNVELCYTRAKQQWDYVTGVISARQCSSTFHPDCV